MVYTWINDRSVLFAVCSELIPDASGAYDSLCNAFGKMSKPHHQIFVHLHEKLCENGSFKMKMEVIERRRSTRTATMKEQWTGIWLQASVLLSLQLEHLQRRLTHGARRGLILISFATCPETTARRLSLTWDICTMVSAAKCGLRRLSKFCYHHRWSALLLWRDLQYKGSSICTICICMPWRTHMPYDARSTSALMCVWLDFAGFGFNITRFL